MSDTAPPNPGRGKGKGSRGKGMKGEGGKGRGRAGVWPDSPVAEPVATDAMTAPDDGGPAKHDGGGPAKRPPRPPKPQQKMENSRPDSESLAGLDTQKPFWWRRLTECDPISLEPLKSLRFPPFELGTDESHATYFDGRILANYLVSTGSFLHPISRRE